jgi:hypothetical protein
MQNEKEQLEQKLVASKESHRGDLFIIYLLVGELLLGFFVGFDNWKFFIGAWIVVWLAWSISRKQVN